VLDRKTEVEKERREKRKVGRDGGPRGEGQLRRTTVSKKPKTRPGGKRGNTGFQGEEDNSHRER